MRRKLALPRLLIALAALLSACQAEAQPFQPVMTRRATFTPLVVKTAIPFPTQLETTSPTARERTSTIPLSGMELVERPLHFILVQHARCAWDVSWCPIEQGILDAAREMNVTVTLFGSESTD
jgi:hypothetical protein